MVVTIMLVYVVTIIILLPKYICVGIDYYDDKKLPEEQREHIQIPQKVVTGNGDNLKNSNISEHNVTDSLNTSHTVKYNIRRDHMYNTMFDRSYEATLLNFTNDDVTTVSTIKTFLPEIWKEEYDYIYEDETNSYILRKNLRKSEQDTIINSPGFSTKPQLTEFYNLEPAVQLMNISVHHSNNYSVCYKAWYVVEDLPCWELPLLFGEFGKRIKKSKVFVLHRGKLKNVIEDHNENKEIRQGALNVPLTYYTNKWCKSSPCYGDHTLCLFPDKQISGMCSENYKVDVPTISEQIALVNTLNSMRNRIANAESDRYSHLPTAANIKQMIYDYDLENFARVWLLQCLPGPEPCSALDETFVNQLECTKFAKFCCYKSFSSQYKKCIPKSECFTQPVIGCLHVWFWNAGKNLTLTDIQCGHTSVLSYNTAQLLWATTYKIGCAYGTNINGDVRVICNFSPGAPYFLETQFYCGILSLKGGIDIVNENISDTEFLKSSGIRIDNIFKENELKGTNLTKPTEQKLIFDENTNTLWGIDSLQKMYTEGQVRKLFKDFTNGSVDMIARLVVKYKFIELNGAKCDSDEPIYIKGPPGSLCLERGRRYNSLCFDYRDPTPGYRLVAVIAPIVLFSLILYDLFSGVVRQTNY